MSKVKSVLAVVLIVGFTIGGAGVSVGFFDGPVAMAQQEIKPNKPAAKQDRELMDTRIPPLQTSIPTVLGPKAFQDGDVIEITDVRSTSPKLEPGDSITVRGRGRLASQDKARLCLYLTQTKGDGYEEADPAQENPVKRGLQKFEVKAMIKHRGVLHLTLYDHSGQPFGGVYFGTVAQMKQIEGWSLDHYLAPADGQARAKMRQ